MKCYESKIKYSFSDKFIELLSSFRFNSIDHPISNLLNFYNENQE